MFINFITGRAGLICAAYRIRVYVCLGDLIRLGGPKINIITLTRCEVFFICQRWAVWR